MSGRNRTRLAALTLLGFAVVLVACGSSKGNRGATGTTTTVAGAVDPNGTESLPPGDIPDNQVFVAYASPVGGYSVKYPQGWAQAQSIATTRFNQNFNTIAVTSTKAPAAPTLTSVRSSELPTLRSLAGFKLGTITPVTRPAGNAIRITYAATSPTDPVTGKAVTLDVERYLFWRNGRLAAITLSSPTGSDNVDPWKTVTDSFAWK